MRACTRRAAVFITAALLNYRETGREQNDYGWEISTSLAVSARAVQVINVLIGWVAFAVPRNFIHRSDFDPDVPLVHHVNLWQTPFSGRAFIFHALKKKKTTTTKQTPHLDQEVGASVSRSVSTFRFSRLPSWKPCRLSKIRGCWWQQRFSAGVPFAEAPCHICGRNANCKLSKKVFTAR